MWSCRHQYHLQCIMQWAQRSRECPMCFRALQLQVCSSSAFQAGGCLQICSVLACWVSWQSMHQELDLCIHRCFLPLLLTIIMLLTMSASCSYVHGVSLHSAQSTTIVNLVGVSLILQDPMMQELLPFGEYIPPEHSQPAQHMYMGLEAWELERILARLAVTNGAPVLSTGRRRGHSRAEAVIVPGTAHKIGCFQLFCCIAIMPGCCSDGIDYILFLRLNCHVFNSRCP